MTTQRVARRHWVVGVGIAAALVATFASAAQVDPATSRVGFTLKTRWGQPLQGRFPDPHGEVAELGGGRHQVSLQLSTRTVEIIDHTAYTRFTRGSGFFDAARYPRVDFVSDAYPVELLRSGGPMPGVLTIRGVRRREVFTISPSTCAQPARDCDVVASGSIRQADYGLGRWNFALADRVRFSLRVRVRSAGGGA